MTTHAHDLVSAIRGAVNLFGGESANSIRHADAVERAVKFDMGSIQEVIDMSEIGTRQFHHLPAQECLFEFEGVKPGAWNAIYASEWDSGTAWCAWRRQATWFSERVAVHIDHDGVVSIHDTGTDREINFHDLDERGSSKWTVRAIVKMATAIEVFSCSNIVQVVHKAPKFTNSKRLKKGKAPISEHRTIVIEARGVRSSPGQTAGEKEGAGMRRLHLCRGHIRVYPSGKKAWVRSHLRGTKAIGSIEHDYKVRRAT